MELQSREELEANLKEYREQLEQVEDLLLSDPDNEEYREIHTSLLEVIDLNEDLLREVASSSGAVLQSAASQPAAPAAGPAEIILTQAPAIHLSSILPVQVAQQIRAAQQKAALAGQAPAAWAIGARCQARGADGSLADGSVVGVSTNGNFVVRFDAGGGEEQVAREHVRPPPEREEVYMGVAAPKLNRVDEAPQLQDMPKWLEIKPTDDEKKKAKKRKLQKSFKSKLRFQKLDLETKARQQSWLDFKRGKGAKKKTGFLSAGKKDSMFSVPEGLEAKVGVIGSGQGMTGFKPRGRHDFAGSTT